MTDFKPGDRVRKIEQPNTEGTVLGVTKTKIWVQIDGWDGPLTYEPPLWEPIPTHPIPSEVNTAWQDRNGDIWMVDENGNLTSAVAYFGDEPEHWAAPFTRLVREGSEREAAIREVVERLRADGMEVAGYIERHFLLGVDQ